MKTPNTVVGMPKGFETYKQCLNEQKVRIRDLENFGKFGSPELAERLRSCEKSWPCGSAACRFCASRLRQAIFRSISTDSELQSVPACMVTIIYYQDAFTTKDLKLWTPNTLHTRLRQQLHRIGLKCPVIGAIELDFQSDIELWMPHYHLLVFATKEEIEPMRGSLLKKNKLPALEGRKLRPLLVEGITKMDSAITYPFKFMWQDRRRFKVELKYRTKKYRLQPELHAKALLALDRIGFDSLVFSSRSTLLHQSSRQTFVMSK
jgi:hypothetical protein